MSEKRDYYEILSVSRDAEGTVIKKSYRKLAVQFHPDKNPDDPTAEDKFKELGEAYEVLMNEEKRAAYDRYGHSAFEQGMGGGGGGSGGGFHDAADIFRSVFGGGGGGSGGGSSIFDDLFGGGGSGSGRSRDISGRQRGSDLRYDLQISLEEAASGVEKELELEKAESCDQCDGKGSSGSSGTKTCEMCGGHGQVISSRGFFQVQQTCPTCNGSGQIIKDPCKKCGGEGRATKTTKIKIRVPAGIDSGTRLRTTGNGEAGVRGGSSGDLFVVIHVHDHDVFEREGQDLFCDVPLAFSTAALGGSLDVPTLEGRSNIKIPAGTQNETVFRLREKGITHLNSSRKGDLHIRVQIEVPTKLNSEQKEKLNAFAESIGQKNSPIHESFFEKAKKFFT
ncbi:MAG: molecular chaperone DnaJ [Verrucomicrobiales bacterium]|jgi:molecular chaperone DnaJ